jgi:hypothetical protein
MTKERKTEQQPGKPEFLTIEQVHAIIKKIASIHTISMLTRYNEDKLANKEKITEELVNIFSKFADWEVAFICRFYIENRSSTNNNEPIYVEDKEIFTRLFLFFTKLEKAKFLENEKLRTKLKIPKNFNL